MKNDAIFFGRQAELKLSQLLLELSPKSKHFILCDSNTLTHCYPVLASMISIPEHVEVLEVDAGEEQKQLEMVGQLATAMLENKADRNSVLFCLGGGMICDLGGFLAAIFKRGITCYYVPTTLLSMVDASIGGKTGVNLHHFKNQIGIITQPKQIFVLPSFLETLPRHELISGWAEVLKHALLGDPSMFSEIISQVKLEMPNQELIKSSAQYKLKIVAKDRNETGLRKVLNLGHTAAHALEFLSAENEQPIPHGYCVAYGLILEAMIAQQYFETSCSYLKPLLAFVKKHFSDFQPEYYSNGKWLKAMLTDKKNTAGSINFTLLPEVGQPQIDCLVETEIIEHSIQQFYAQFE